MPPLFKRRQSSPNPTQRQIEERRMVLERLQCLSQGLDPWMLIEPTIAAARTRQETYDQANNQLLQDEDYGIPTADTFDEDNTQRNFIEDVQAIHTKENQREWQNRTRTQWEDVLPSLHGAYLLLKAHTKNWMLQNSFDNHTHMFCDCSDNHYRTVDLIDLNGTLSIFCFGNF
jgi:hypothetical protein